MFARKDSLQMKTDLDFFCKKRSKQERSEFRNQRRKKRSITIDEQESESESEFEEKPLKSNRRKLQKKRPLVQKRPKEKNPLYKKLMEDDSDEREWIPQCQDNSAPSESGQQERCWRHVGGNVRAYLWKTENEDIWWPKVPGFEVPISESSEPVNNLMHREPWTAEDEEKYKDMAMPTTKDIYEQIMSPLIPLHE